MVRGPLTHLENSEIRLHWRVHHELVVSFFGHGCSELLLKRRQDLQGCCSEEGCGLLSGEGYGHGLTTGRKGRNEDSALEPCRGLIFSGLNSEERKTMISQEVNGKGKLLKYKKPSEDCF